MARPLEGVGPQVSRILRLDLDGKGYPRGDMLAFLRTVPLDEALELERVSHRARWEIGQITDLVTADIRATKGGGRG